MRNGNGNGNHALTFEEVCTPDNQQYVFGICRRILPRVEDAEDAMQDTFLHAFYDFPNYRGENLRGWLYSIARNRSLAMSNGFIPFDGRWARQGPPIISLDEQDRDLPSTSAINNYGEQIASDCLNPEQALEFERVCAVIPDDPILVLKFEGFQEQEIAEMLNVSLSLVKIRIFRTRKQIRRAGKRPPQRAHVGSGKRRARWNQPM